MVVVRTTASAGCLDEILKPCEPSWNGLRLIRPSVVLIGSEGGVARATSASVNGVRSRSPAVAASAQRAYDGLTPARQAAARQVFTRLAAAGSDGLDSADRATRAELIA